MILEPSWSVKFIDVGMFKSNWKMHEEKVKIIQTPICKLLFSQ